MIKGNRQPPIVSPGFFLHSQDIKAGVNGSLPHGAPGKTERQSRYADAPNC